MTHRAPTLTRTSRTWKRRSCKADKFPPAQREQVDAWRSRRSQLTKSNDNVVHELVAIELAKDKGTPVLASLAFQISCFPSFISVKTWEDYSKEKPFLYS